MAVSYSPRIFDTASLDEAKAIILTHEDRSTAERWEKETPYLVSLIGPCAGVLLDYGCGVGRMSKALLEAHPRLTAVGLDQSATMRGLASGYVGSKRFTVISGDTLRYYEGEADVAIAVWVIQHCAVPAADLGAIYRTLKPGGIFHVVNDFERAVPVVGGRSAWLRDGQNVRKLCERVFGAPEEFNRELSPDALGPIIAGRSYYARYRRV